MKAKQCGIGILCTKEKGRPGMALPGKSGYAGEGWNGGQVTRERKAERKENEGTKGTREEKRTREESTKEGKRAQDGKDRVIVKKTGEGRAAGKKKEIKISKESRAPKEVKALQGIMTAVKKSKAAEILLQLLFPRRCPVCDGIVQPAGEKICTECLRKPKLLTPPWCMKCGKKLAGQGEYCSDCRRKEHDYVRGRGLYEYGSILLSIYRFKYGGRQEYADFFGEQMAQYLGDFVSNLKPDALVPIPLHKKRMAVRGYNQARLLAEAFGERLNIPVCADFLVREKNTAPLKYENPKERQNNLKKAFNIARNDVKLKRVILIDDIYTTGSTIDEAARTLKAAGVEEVYFVTLACGVSSV